MQIAIIKLPSISNYDDFSALEHESGVRVIYIDSAEMLAHADLAILPGSKSTMRDLAWMREHGLDRALQSRSKAGGLTLGICGGCQMLGRKIEDPHHVESSEAETEGLALLPMITRFEKDKRTTQVRAVISETSFLGDVSTDIVFDAYEIHMGRTIALNGAASPFRIIRRNGDACDAADGAISANQTTVGTMLHGIFENDHLRTSMLTSLRNCKGLPTHEASTVASRDAEYDRLATAVRASLDIASIKRIAGIA